jgi:signal transduction histidine kinase
VKTRLTILLVLIIVAPLAILGWLGARLAWNEQAVVDQRFKELAAGQLRAVDLALRGAIERFRDAVLGEMPASDAAPAELRLRTFESPFVVQYYVLETDGRIVFPPIAHPAELTRSERESLERTRHVWESGALLAATAASETPVTASDSGFHSGYWKDGLQWMLWKRGGRRIVVAEVNRAMLLGALIAALPDTHGGASSLTDGRIRLLDASARPLYEWGAYEPDKAEPPVASLAPSAPLGPWRLEYHAPAAVLGGGLAGSLVLSLTVGLALLAAVVVASGIYLYREQSREMRQAAERVTFVNQVSHELKTPLTSIRMYAELLEASLEDDDQARRQLGVIVSESQRLSRLIANVLTFGRAQRGALTLHLKRGVVDETLERTLGHFAPTLAAKEIAPAFRPGAGLVAAFDPDALEQIVGNLISNVEKYAADGKSLALESHQDGERVEIVVADRGPGLSARDRRRIFEPFYRVGNALTEGVSGTGIGLTIARDLARLHGGDLELLPAERGARFRLTLTCPLAPTEEG